MKRHLASCLALVLFVLGGSRAVWAAPGGLVLVRPPCEPEAFDEGELERLLGVELADAGLGEVTIVATAGDVGSVPGALLDRLVLTLDGSCADGGVIDARLRSLTRPGETRRSIGLADVLKEARARTIAIAIAEHVRTSLSFFSLPGPLPPPVPSPPPRPLPLPRPPRGAPTRVVTTSPVTRWTVLALADARGFFPAGGAFFGAHVGMQYALPPFTIGGAAGAWHGSATDTLGGVGEWLVSGAVNGALGGRVGEVEIQAGPEIEAGWVRATGTPESGANGHTGDALVILASLRGDLRFAIGGPLWGVLDAGFGGALRGYYAIAHDTRDRYPLAVRNATARGGLGLAAAF